MNKKKKQIKLKKRVFVSYKYNFLHCCQIMLVHCCHIVKLTKLSIIFNVNLMFFSFSINSRAKTRTLKIDKCSSDNLTFQQFPIREFIFTLSNRHKEKFKKPTKFEEKDVNSIDTTNLKLSFKKIKLFLICSDLSICTLEQLHRLSH